MKHLIAVALILMMLAGCATTAYRTAATAHKSESEMKVDLYECRSSGTFLFGPLIILLPLMAIVSAAEYAAQKSCLEARGYRVGSGEGK